MVEVARSELILGGQKSGKSRRAEDLARQWLASSASHCAVLVATAEPWDEEMRQRIARHRSDRAERVPGLCTVEESRELEQVLRRHAAPQTLIVVDCLTLWLTHLMMPLDPAEALAEAEVNQRVNGVCDAVRYAPGPVVLVGNEIGLGVIPLGAEVRRFVDTLGRLNQQVAGVTQQVTLMVAGCPLVIKGGRS